MSSSVSRFVRTTLLAAGLCAVLGLPDVAAAQPHLVRVGSFASPVYVTAAPGDPSRLFVVERGGVVRLIKNGTVRKQPFLTIRDVQASGPGGLLSIAFAPNYATSGRFYAFYTDQTGIRVAEYRRARPDLADASSRRIVLTQPHSSANPDHYAGQLQFGPDGLLYIAIGDGGPGGDPSGRAQDLGQLFGKILRINPIASGSVAYTVPATNPYVGVAGARPEIWASGLRNPWRFSFDRSTGDLVIADVGQERADEIDFAPASGGGGRGANFGWNCFEGFQPYSGCTVAPHAQPLMEKPLPASSPDWCHYSITGGYVARDPSLSFAGRYVYGDFCSGEIRSVDLHAANPASDDAATGIPNLPRTSLVSFGEDDCGRLYAVSINGPVYRIEDAAGSHCP